VNQLKLKSDGAGRKMATNAGCKWDGHMMRQFAFQLCYICMHYEGDSRATLKRTKHQTTDISMYSKSFEYTQYV